jgi:4-amino-4-deoxy-L-arabinose transferase-like glycosyltransferase
MVDSGITPARRLWLSAPVVIILVAIVARALVVAADTGYRPQNDALEYDYIARSIAAGNGYPPSGYLLQGGPTAVRGPAYPFLLGTVYALSDDSTLAGRLLNVLIGASIVALLFLVCKRIWGRRVALVAAALAAVFPPLVLLSRDLVSESLFIALELAAVLCVLEFRRSGALLRWAATAGLACGLAVLTRPTAYAVLLAILVGVWIQRPRLRLRALAAPVLCLACAVVVTVPWIVRDAVEFGRFVPVTTSAGIATSGTYNEVARDKGAEPGAWIDPQIVPRFRPLFETPGLDEAEVDSTLSRDARQFAWENPGYVAETVAWNLLRLFEVEGGSVVNLRAEAIYDRGIGSALPLSERVGLALAVLLGAVGLFTVLGPWSRDVSGRRTVPRGPLFFWLVPIGIAVVTLPVAGLPRYRLPLDPFILTLTAIGLLALWDRRPSAARTSAREVPA